MPSIDSAAFIEKIRDFSFPLNVYVYLLFLEEGQAEYLHFGLYLEDGISFPEAQRNSTKLIRSLIPQPPCRILEVGIGLGTTSELLAEQGYQVHGISPDAQQISYARQSVGDKDQLSCERYEDFKDNNRFDLILFQESAQYIDPLSIFTQASKLLDESGQLLIVDEFALRRTESGLENLHLLKDLIALGERFGFELLKHQDLSPAAAPTIDYLLRASVEHRQSILQNLCLTPEQLNQLDASNRIYRDKYASGRFGYALLHFVKKQTPKWSLSTLDDSASEDFLSLFAKVFQHTMSRDFWQWKYGDGKSDSIVAWLDGQMVGHYGGQRREVLFKGCSVLAVQNGDVMVDVKGRGGMSRKGPFFLAATTFFERYVGFGKKYLFAFGFPNSRAMRVAEHLGLYEAVDKIVQVTWPACKERLNLLTCQLVVQGNADENTRQQINDLWRCMAEDLKNSIIGVRNWEYIRQRYLDCPEKEYHVILIRRRISRAPVGAFVVRREGDQLLLLDVIAPLKNFSQLIRHARMMGERFGLKNLQGWVSKSHQNVFLVDGAAFEETDIQIPAQKWTDGPDLSALCNRWWLTSGDTDFL